MKKRKILLILAMALCLTSFGAVGCLAEGTGSSSSDSQSSSSMPENKLVVSETYFKLRVGETVKLNAYTADGSAITYLSETSSVATVNENGEIAAVSSGVAFIVIKAGSETVTCKVEVYEIGYSIELSKTEISLVDGSNEKIIATVKQDGEICEETVEWSVDGVGTIESNGNTVTYTANGVGVATISAKIGKATVDCAVKIMSATAVELPAPVFTEESNCVEVSWGAVEGAGKYQIKLNDGSWVETTETKYSFKDDATANKYENGKLVDYRVSVRCIVAENNYDYYNSAPTTITVRHDHEVTYTNPNATCTEPTAMAYICKVCENGYEEGEYYKDHVYADGACETCDNAQTAGILYAYDETLNGYVVAGIDKDAYDGKTETVYVRGTYDDGTNGEKPVVAIGEAAFDAGTMTNVILPESITSIGAVAFRGCTSLVEVRMTGVTQINENSCYAFIGCSALERLIVGAELTLDSTTKEATVAQYFAGVYGIDGANGIFVPAEDSEDFVKTTDDQGRYYGTYDKATDTLTVVDYGTDGAKILYNEYKIYTQIFPGANNVAILSVAEKESAALTLNLGDGDASRVSGVYYYADEVVCGTDTWNYNEEGKTEIGNVHIFVDGECTRCGLKEMTGVVYVYDGETDTYTVTGLAEGYDPTDLVIPATFDNGLNGEANVVAIAANAFINNATIKTLTIGENVKTIESSAFRFCTELEKVTFLGDVKTWGNVAFGNCTALTTVDLSKQTLTPITNGNAIFMDCTALKTVFVNNNLQFGWDAFNLSNESIKCEKANAYVIGTREAGETYFAEMTASGTANKLIGKIFYYDESKTADGSWYYDENGAPTPLNERTYYATTSYWGNTYMVECSVTGLHAYTEETASGAYLAEWNVSEGYGTFYKSCICGEAGTETFTYTYTDEDKLAYEPTSLTVSLYDAANCVYGFTYNTEEKPLYPVLQIQEGDQLVSAQYEEYAVTVTEAMTYKVNGQTLVYYIAKVEVELDPSSTYTYRLYDKYVDIGTEEYTLTAKNTDSETFKFSVVTDTQTIDNTGGYFGAVLENITDSDFIVHTGDVVEWSKYESYWEAMLDGNAEYLSRIPVMAISGNHETTYQAGTNETYKHFNYKLPEQSTELGIYYSYVYGNVKFIMLNTNDLGTDNKLKTEQYNWLISELQNNTCGWTVVAMHHPMYSVGPWGSNPDSNQIAVALTEQLQGVFAEYGVDIVLQGHDHTVSRTYAIDGEGNVATETTQTENGVIYTVDPNGVIYVVNGTAGSTTRNPYDDVDDALYAYGGGSNASSWTEFEVTADTITVTMKYTDGTNVSVYHTWGIKKTGSSNPVVTEPLAYSYEEGVGYTVTGLNDTSVTNVVIPATYDDGVNGEASVVAIASGAFKDNATIVSVSITSSAAGFTIGETAFNNCSALTMITINAPDFITIGGNAIINCPALTTLICGNRFTLPDQGVLANLSVYPEAAKQVDVYVLTAYGTESQAINWNLTADGTTFGGNNMISNKAYFYSETEVAGGWRYVDGVATPWDANSYYTKNATAWSFDAPADIETEPTPDPEPDVVEPLTYTYANGGYTVTGLNDTSVTNVVIPVTYNDGVNGEASVVAIAANAFTGNTTITSVTITSQITINSQAFMGCTALTTVTIVASDFITWSGDMQFYNCKSLRTLICGNRFTIPDRLFFANCNEGAYPEAYQSMNVYVSTAYGADSQAINWDSAGNTDMNGANNLVSNKVYFYSETKVAGGWRYVDGVATAWDVDSYYTKNATAWAFDAPTA